MSSPTVIAVAVGLFAAALFGLDGASSAVMVACGYVALIVVLAVV